MKQFRLILGGVGCLLLTACSSLSSTMTASSDVNRDINGNPSAIAVSVFELSNTSTFKKASFVSLYTNPQGVLGSSLLAQRSLMLAPGQTTTVSLPVIESAQYLAYIAAYRNLNTSTWQVLVPINSKGLLGQQVNLNVSATGISIEQ